MRSPASHPIASKRCAICGFDKPVGCFLPTRFVADGRTATCKECTFARAEHDRHCREVRRLAKTPETKPRRKRCAS